MMTARSSEGSPPGFSSGRQLFGRERERKVLDRLLDGGAAGAACMVLHGEAGVGKTALLEYAVEAGREFRVARTSGRRSGDGAPVRGGSAAVFPVSRLCGPSPSAAAARRSASRSDSARGRRRIRSWSDWRSSACCPRRRRSGRSSPLLMTRIGWTTRRRGRLRSWLAACWRSRSRSCSRRARSTTRSAGLPELLVSPLRHRDARALLESVLPARLDEPVLERIVVETRGNPLALLELPRGLTPDGAGGRVRPARRRAAVCQHRGELHAATREPSQRCPALVARGGGRPGRRPRARVAGARSGSESRSRLRTCVESEDLLVLGPRVVFRHPLVRSAVYRAATPNERREVHRALAEATDPELDPDRRAWHRAQAASKPDEDVAAELEESAARAQARGGFAAAAAFLERATALTPETVAKVGARARRGPGKVAGRRAG